MAPGIDLTKKVWNEGKTSTETHRKPGPGDLTSLMEKRKHPGRSVFIGYI